MCSFCNSVHYVSLGNPDPVFLTSVLADGELGNGGIISLLFESPSGFSIFKYDGVQLFLSNAMEVRYVHKLIWSMYLLALLPFALSLISFFLDLLCRLLQNMHLGKLRQFRNRRRGRYLHLSFCLIYAVCSLSTKHLTEEWSESQWLPFFFGCALRFIKGRNESTKWLISCLLL